jgi:DNA-binding HxlR family transcriptional regulator
MRLIGSAWTANVIWFLREGERCFTELQTDLSGVSAKVLTSRLRTLQQEGIVERLERATSPPTVWYALTPIGQELCRALVDVIEVGQRLRKARMSATADLTARSAAADRETRRSPPARA